MPPKIRKRTIVREEPFGYTVFDEAKIRYKFVKKEDFKSRQINGNNVEIWPGNLSKSPKDKIYSPIRIYFELTSKCNLRCKTCFNQSGIAKPNEMSTEEVKKALDGLRRDNIIEIRFSGGEITQREDWFEILQYAKKKGFVVSVNTNGVYENDDIIEKLAGLDLAQITISIDGGKKFHNFIRGEGKYEKAIKTISELYKRKSSLRINTLLTKGSADDLKEILDLANRYVEEINFFYMRTAGRALNILEHVISYRKLYEFDKKIESLKPEYPHMRILHGSKVMLMNSIDTDKKDNFGLKMGGPDGFTRLNILPDGSIWPGGYTPHIKLEYCLGNIKEENYSIINIWRNSRKLDEFREKSLNLQKRCLKCPEKNIRCPGASMEMEFYRETNPKNKNPYCIY